MLYSKNKIHLKVKCHVQKQIPVTTTNRVNIASSFLMARRLSESGDAIRPDPRYKAQHIFIRSHIHLISNILTTYVAHLRPIFHAA